MAKLSASSEAQRQYAQEYLEENPEMLGRWILVSTILKAASGKGFVISGQIQMSKDCKVIYNDPDAVHVAEFIWASSALGKQLKDCFKRGEEIESALTFQLSANKHPRITIAEDLVVNGEYLELDGATSYVIDWDGLGAESPKPQGASKPKPKNLDA